MSKTRGRFVGQEAVQLIRRKIAHLSCWFTEGMLSPGIHHATLTPNNWPIQSRHNVHQLHKDYMHNCDNQKQPTGNNQKIRATNNQQATGPQTAVNTKTFLSVKASRPTWDRGAAKLLVFPDASLSFLLKESNPPILRSLPWKRPYGKGKGICRTT